MNTFRFFFFAACLLLLVGNLSAQPYFFLTNEPANGVYYEPGDTVTAIFTIMEDGSFSSTRVTSKTTSNVIADLQPVLTLTDHYPPVKEHQVAILVPADFSSQDSIFVFEVTATKYGTLTLDFKLRGVPSSVDYKDTRYSSLTLYPNPTRNTVTLSSLLASQNSQVSIISSDGKQVSGFGMGIDRDQSTLDVSFLTAGNYVILLTSPQGSAFSKLIIR
jgi:hypothetical protein